MIKLIVKTGRFITSLVITIIAVILSQLITWLIYKYSNGSITISGRIASWASPLLIAPFLSWWFVGLLLRINSIEQEMRDLATYDTLTGVFNRRTFFDIAVSLLNLMKREKQDLTILFIDIDHFKNINDSYGHDAGDAILKEFGSHLLKKTRKSDVVGRIGGEEFLIALPKTNGANGYRIAETIRQGLIENKTVSTGSNSFKITISIGISSFNGLDDCTIDQLVKHADSALYEAKEKGRNRVAIRPALAPAGDAQSSRAIA